jgi:Glycosyltransferase family 43
MGGLSFHTSVLFTKQKPRFSLQWELGFLETKFLQLILSSKSELEPLMDDCRAIFVWHVTTKYPYEDKHGTPKSMQTEDSLHLKILPSV